MAKKAGTQIIESLETMQCVDGICSMPQTERDRLIKLAKRVDKRDEQNRVARKPAKKATR